MIFLESLENIKNNEKDDTNISHMTCCENDQEIRVGVKDW